MINMIFSNSKEFENFCRSYKVPIIVVLEHKIKKGKVGKTIQRIIGK